MLQVVTQQKRRTGCACAQQVVPAAVAVFGFGAGAGLHSACLLRKAGKGIVFTQKADHGLSAAKGAAKGCGNSGHAALYPKALLLHKIFQCRRRLGFAEFQFGQIPYPVAELLEGFIIIL